MTNANPIRILLIEDNPGDALLISEMFSEAGNDLFEMTHADCLSTGLFNLAEERFDLLLLDLSLPDSQGLDSFIKANNQAPDLPIIVITGTDDSTVAVKSVGQGAQDYLVKGQIDANLLTRSIRYAMERQSLKKQLEKTHKRLLEERERSEAVRNFQHYVAISDGEKINDVYEKLTSEYRDIVFRYVHAVRIREDRPADLVKRFARHLANIDCRARDLVRIHLKVLNDYAQRSIPSEEHAFSNDARLVLVELMGHLMDIYRGKDRN